MAVRWLLAAWIWGAFAGLGAAGEDEVKAAPKLGLNEVEVEVENAAGVKSVGQTGIGSGTGPKPSMSGCNLAIQEYNNLRAIECELALFGPFPENISGRVYHSPSNELGCEPYEEDLSSFIVVAKRGECAMSQKARNAQSAGAVGFVCIHSTEGTAPRRMTSIGNEIELVSIPSVMVSLEDGSWLLENLGHDMNNMMGMLSHGVRKGHALEREWRLKRKIFQPQSRKDQVEREQNLMRLGEYFSRGNESSEAGVFIYSAASTSKSYDVVNGAASFFWNVRKEYKVAANLYLDATAYALKAIKENATEAEWDSPAMHAIRSIVVLIPEDKPQLQVVKTLSHLGNMDLLARLLKYLHQQGKLGSTAVWTWADFADDIGDYQGLLETLSDFLEGHPMRKDDSWLSITQSAYETAVASCRTHHAPAMCPWEQLADSAAQGGPGYQEENLEVRIDEEIIF